MNNTILGPGTPTSTTTTGIDSLWSTPELIKTEVYSDHIDQIFKQTSLTTLLTYPPPPPQQRVFKITYSCQNGEWHVSDRIYGEIIPQQSEKYIF